MYCEHCNEDPCICGKLFERYLEEKAEAFDIDEMVLSMIRHKKEKVNE